MDGSELSRPAFGRRIVQRRWHGLLRLDGKAAKQNRGIEAKTQRPVHQNPHQQNHTRQSSQGLLITS
jgi:hypothetical protein